MPIGEGAGIGIDVGRVGAGEGIWPGAPAIGGRYMAGEPSGFMEGIPKPPIPFSEFKGII
jgi:hypothetical protein